MLKTVSQYKDSIAAILSGIDLSNIDNLNGAIERAARTLVQKADISEASGIQNITLYDGVFDYLCDTRIFGTAINDIRPQGISRYPWDQVTKVNQADFDRTKNFYYPSGTNSTFQYKNGIPVIRIVAPYPKQQIVLDTMTQLTGWIAGGSANNLSLDSTFFYQTPASLRFNLAALGSSGTLSKTLQSQLNLSSYIGVGMFFLAVEMPSASDITSYTIRIGSDSSDYYSMTATKGFITNFTSGEFQLVAFDFSNYTTTGTPNISAIQYVQVIVNYDGVAQVAMRVGDLFASLPSSSQILFQSAAIFLPSGASNTLTTITSDTDSIILNDAAYTLFEYEGAISICQQTGGTTGSATIGTLESVLNGARARNGTIITQGLYDLYRGDNPSQQIRTLGTYYDNGPSYESSNGSWN